MQMSMQAKTKSFLSVFALAVALSVLSIIGAGGPLLFLRRQAGRIWFFAATTIIALGFYLFGFTASSLSFLSCATLVFIFAEAKALDCDDWKSGLISLLSLTGIISLVTGAYIQITGFDLLNYLKTEMQNLVQQMESIQSGFPLTAEMLFQQLPGILIIGFILCLWFSVLLENSLSKSFRLALSTRSNLLSFKTPDYVVWFSIAGFLFALVDLGSLNLKIIANNLLMVLSAVYFLQGMAVAASFLRRTKLFPAFRFLILLFFAFQLFFMISFIGYMDFWVDFRKRFINKSVDKLV